MEYFLPYLDEKYIEGLAVDQKIFLKGGTLKFNDIIFFVAPPKVDMIRRK